LGQELRHAGDDKRTLDQSGLKTASDWQKTAVTLLRHQVLLLAMKDGRAPLPVSPALGRGLQRQGFLNDIYDLGIIARRLLFLGDSRILLAELRSRSTASQAAEEKSAKESKMTNEVCSQFKDQGK